VTDEANGHRDFVRTSWGGYYVDPMQIEEARREGQRWAEVALVEIRRRLDRLSSQRRRRRRQ
jgi:hypothetical protein